MADAPTRFEALPARQKVTVIVFLLIFVFIIWEVIGMFRGGGSSGQGGGNGGTITAVTAKPASPAMTSTPPKAAQATPMASKPVPQPQLQPPSQPSGPPPGVMVSAPGRGSPTLSKPTVEPSLPPSGFLVQQDQVQNKYVSALNDLQMLKIQKEIAETSQAIVTAKLATVTAEKSISDVLEESKMPPGVNSKNTVATTSTAVAPPPPPGPGGLSNDTGTYSVQSVTMEQDQWHAVIKLKKKLYDVSVGDVMPPDGSLVKAIDQRGVTLELGGVEQKIPLTVTDNEPTMTKEGAPDADSSSDSSSK